MKRLLVLVMVLSALTAQAGKFGVFDGEGKPTAFYSSEVNKTIPSSAVAISDAQWREFLANQGLRRWAGAGQALTVISPPTEAELEAAYEAGKSDTLKVVETVYCEFLEEEYTTALHAAGIIPTNRIITASTITHEEVINHFAALRAWDTAPLRPTYIYYKTEFSNLQDQIKALGGITLKAQKYE